MSDCFWFTQGKCFLNLTPVPIVLEILEGTPQARIDYERCFGSDQCSVEIDPIIIEYMARNPKLVPSDEISALRQSRLNGYTDHSQYDIPIGDKDD